MVVLTMLHEHAPDVNYRLGHALSAVTLVNPRDKVVWDVWPQAQEPLDNSTIDK